MTQQVEQPLPPANWYSNQYGQMQWWDGHQWGATAMPPTPPTPTTNGYAVTALVAGILALPAFALYLISSSPWLLYIVGFVPIVLAGVFGCIGLARANKTGGVGRSLAMSGLVAGLFVAACPVVFLL